MPKLHQLRYLAALADTLHFRRAAERVHVAQPTLSGQIRELEQRLGVRLVERSRSQVRLTPIGVEIAARSRDVLAQVQEIVDLARQGQSATEAPLHLGLPPSLGPYLLPIVLAELQMAVAPLRLAVREGSAHTLLDALASGDLDLMLSPLPVPTAELIEVELLREPLWLVAGASMDLGGPGPRTPADLAGRPLLALGAGHWLHDQARDLADRFGLALAADFEGSSLETLWQMAAANQGLALLPALYVAERRGRDDRVAMVETAPLPPAWPIGLTWRRGSAHGDLFRDVAARLGKVVREALPGFAVTA